jgi:hypothetical protein
MADSNGGVFAFGESPFFGSAADVRLQGSIVGMAPSLVPEVNPRDFTIAGDVPTALLPGTTAAVDLRITNPNSTPITVISNAISVTTSRDGCSPSNFMQVQDLARPVTVPAGTTATLSQLGLPRPEWPAIGMLDTATSQDACKNAVLALHYRGVAVG